MAETSSFLSWQRLVITFASIVLIVGALILARSLLIPVAFAIFLSLVLSPLVGYVQHMGLRRVPAVLLVVLVALGVLIVFGSLVFSELKSFAADLPEHKKEIQSKIDNLRHQTEGTWLRQVSKGVAEIGEAYKKLDATSQPEGSIEAVPVTIETSNLSVLQSLASPALQFLADSGLVTVLVVFMLIQREELRNRFIKLCGEGSLTTMTKAIDEAMTRISRFLSMQVILNGGVGAAIGIGLLALGVPYGILWGVLAGMLRFIPYVGIWSAALFPLILSAAVSSGWLQPVLVVVLFLAVEATAFNLFEPWLFGHSIGVSPVALLIATAFWAWVWGPVGLVLSAPLTACIAVLGKYVPLFAFFHVLLGDEPALETDISLYQRLLAGDPDEAGDLVENFLSDHTVEDLCDCILIPALVLIKHDRSRNKITLEDQQHMLEAVRELIDQQVFIEQPPALEHAGKDQKVVGDDARSVLVLGCPASDEIDELALYIFGRLLRLHGRNIEVISAQKLSGEIVLRVNEAKPAMVIIVSLPPGGVRHAGYLCKRLRSRFPGLTILVGCWGMEETAIQACKRLGAAGVNQIGTTLAESRKQLVPVVQHQTHVSALAQGGDTR
jgi:predicted PurR-regulated permease PerM